jgi:hypothetical protein
MRLTPGLAPKYETNQKYIVSEKRCSLFIATDCDEEVMLTLIINFFCHRWWGK